MNPDDDKDKPTTDEGGFTPEQVVQIKPIVVAALPAGKPTTDDPDLTAPADPAEPVDPAAETGEPTAIEKAKTAIEEAKEHLDQTTTNSLNRRLKRLRRSTGTVDTIAALKRKVAKLEISKPAMDTGVLLKQIGARAQLARKLTPFVGVFDHAPMTVQQVAEYGVEKLGIQCGKGIEAIALDARLQGRAPDYLVFNGKRYDVTGDADWYVQYGWKSVLCIEAGNYAG